MVDSVLRLLCRCGVAIRRTVQMSNKPGSDYSYLSLDGSGSLQFSAPSSYGRQMILFPTSKQDANSAATNWTLTTIN